MSEKIERSDGVRARLGSISATLAPWPAIVFGPARGIATAQLRNVEMSAPASATPLGQPVTVTRGRLDVSRPHRRRRIDHHNRSSLPSETERLLLGG